MPATSIAIDPTLMAGSTKKTPARKSPAKKTAAKAATRRAPTGRSTAGAGNGGRTLVIVESPTKARTISRFLPGGYKVLASVGHVRDLPQNASEIPEKYKKDAWARIGVDVDNDFAPLYVVPGGSRKVLTEIRAALKDVDQLYLATDEDREGESISWHLLQELKPKVPVRRMVFHEITERAILQSLDETRDVDENLVKAQEARRIIDRLTGYTVSPLLWTTVAPRLSAGRVQSVAVKLVVVRERERRAFRSGTWWDLVAQLAHLDAQFEAKLVAVGGRRLATGRDFDKTTGRLTGAEGASPRDLVLLDEAAGTALVARLRNTTWKVTDRTEEPFTTRPSPPFTTSTLQQEANRKLGLGAREAMRVAQDLYERGFITYMRTDSVSLSAQAIDAARACARQFGPEYVPEKPRFYASKNSAVASQEAHEAIRPSGERFKSPDETGLSGRELRLYDLIWKRTVASQMPDSRQTRMVVTIAADDAEFRASGKRIDFAGFIRAYVEGSDDPDAALDDKEVVLPALVVGDTPQCRALDALKHETQPPARYTEASLVKALEELGIGRPSTYASIMDTIQARGYVRQDGKALVPTFTAFAVTSLLEERITSLVDTQFTAKMESQLDEIAEGGLDQLAYLKQFFFGTKANPGLKPMVEESAAALKKEMGGARRVQLEGVNADIKIGRYGPYVEVIEDGTPMRASLPGDMAPGDLTDELVQELLRTRQEGPPVIGHDPETGKPIYMMRGEYGPYVQLGDVEEDSKVKPKRTSLPKGITPENITLEIALGLVSLPRQLGMHSETGNPIRASLGRFGPFVVHIKGGDGGKDDYRSIPATDDVLTIALPRALELFSQPKARRGQTASVVTPLRELGAHPEDGRTVLVFDGRYGPYVQLGPNTSDRKAKPIRATLPNDVKPDAVTMAQAVQLLEAKAGKPIVKKKPARKKTARARG
ncbi:MAG TPA: type I DNA topoisomerase [Gemmatimonadaceae bacterium]|nr:type I DNA topoisomerase [Gemmatimonadaceae bacterium]